jgi:hypothetical protein
VDSEDAGSVAAWVDWIAWEEGWLTVSQDGGELMLGSVDACVDAVAGEKWMSSVCVDAATWEVSVVFWVDAADAAAAWEGADEAAAFRIVSNMLSTYPSSWFWALHSSSFFLRFLHQPAFHCQAAHPWSLLAIYHLPS